jgi:hypothetical protein
MAWAVGGILVIAVGLPLVAWFVTRHWEHRPPDISYNDRVQAWLLQAYGLPRLQRLAIQRAVEAGQHVGDPALEAAAHGLAAQILSGDLPGPSHARLKGWLVVAAGLALIGGEVALYMIPGNDNSWGGGTAFLGVLVGGGGVTYILLPRRRPRAARRALELNRATVDDS